MPRSTAVFVLALVIVIHISCRSFRFGLGPDDDKLSVALTIDTDGFPKPVVAVW